MKSIALILVYIVSFMLFYIVLSIIGVLWHSYEQVIKNQEWFLVYSMFLGWWLSIFPTLEYYETNREYFRRIF